MPSSWQAVRPKQVALHQRRLLLELTRAVADDVEGGGTQTQLLAAVVLDLVPRAVVVLAIEFDDELLLSPYGVDQHPRDVYVDLGERDPDALAHGQEQALEVAA